MRRRRLRGARPPQLSPRRRARRPPRDRPGLRERAGRCPCSKYDIKMMSVKCELEVSATSQLTVLIECALQPPRSLVSGGVLLAACVACQLLVWQPGRSDSSCPANCVACHARTWSPPARAARRSARSEALADPAPPLPALAGPVAAGHDRAHVRADLHGAVARNPDPGPEDDRQRDRRR